MGPTAIGDAPFINPKTKRAKSSAFCSRRYHQRILSAYGGICDDSVPPFCGRIDNRPIYISPPYQPFSLHDLQLCLDTCGSYGSTEADILAPNYAPGVVRHAFDAMQECEINIVPHLIPPELFDKSGTKIRKIRFPEAACVHVVSTVKNRNISLQLMNYEVRGPVGGSDRIAKQLSKNRNAFVVEDGNLVRVSRDRKGNITKAVLTGNWIDWIDYWAVDFGDRENSDCTSVDTAISDPDFVNDWESYRMRTHRALERTSGIYTYARPGRYQVAVKVIDIFGYETVEYQSVNVD